MHQMRILFDARMKVPIGRCTSVVSHKEQGRDMHRTPRYAHTNMDCAYLTGGG